MESNTKNRVNRRPDTGLMQIGFGSTDRNSSKYLQIEIDIDACNPNMIGGFLCHVGELFDGKKTHPDDDEVRNTKFWECKEENLSGISDVPF